MLRRVMSLQIKRLLILSAMLFGASCGTTRVVFVSESVSAGNVVRMGPSVKGRVFFQNSEGEWVLSKNKVTLPEGWYAGSLDGEEDRQPLSRPNP